MAGASYIQPLIPTASDLWVLPLEGGPETRKPHVFLQTPFTEVGGLVSPDGRWVTYRSNESGRDEVYVRPFPGPGGKWQISTGGVIAPAWSPKGNELFYRTGAQAEKLMAVDIQTQPPSAPASPGWSSKRPVSRCRISGWEAPIIPSARTGSVS